LSSKEGGRDQGYNHSKEHRGAQNESVGNAPRLSHEQLVKGFRDYIQQELQSGYHRISKTTPELLIHKKLTLESQTGNGPNAKTALHFWRYLRYAWDALVYDRYRPGSPEESEAGYCLYHHYHSGRPPGGPTIKLSDPQVRVLDALAEAVGIPHQKGQKEIVIPEKLRDYSKYQLTKEYQERVTKARSERNNEK
jgi:hypothetical protein